MATAFEALAFAAMAARFRVTAVDIVFRSRSAAPFTTTTLPELPAPPCHAFSLVILSSLCLSKRWVVFSVA